eukprot:scaffold15721_cov38-Phaeocystis_antarctica.AAC.1
MFAPSCLTANNTPPSRVPLKWGHQDNYLVRGIFEVEVTADVSVSKQIFKDSQNSTGQRCAPAR